MNHLWWIIPVSILLAALLWLVLFLVYEKFCSDRRFARYMRQLESAREEYPALLVSINQILTDYDPDGIVDYGEDYEGHAAGIIYRLNASVKVVDIRTSLREEFDNPWGYRWFLKDQDEAAAVEILEAWHEHLAREI